MKLTVKDFSLEMERLVVKAADETRTRARRAVAGWEVQERTARADGKVELTFARKKLGSAEVTP